MSDDFVRSARLAVSFFHQLKRRLPGAVPLQQGNQPTSLRPPLAASIKATLEKQRSAHIQYLLDVENHLQFVECLLKRYPSMRSEVTDLIQEIQERNQDPRLYLGIIGEFNSGKSSFINALLRDPFLSVSSKPATTCIPTVLSWSQELQATVFFAKGQQKRFADFRSLWITLLQQLHVYSETAKSKCLRNFVQQYSAIAYGNRQDDEHAATLSREIHSVQVGYPSQSLLQKGLVIIDTPGANAIQSHDQLTGDLTHRFCDTCIILIPKETPGSQTLIQFIKRYLKDILHHCIFIVHKTDTIPSREREKFLQKIQDILKRELKEFNIQDPLVLPASSQMLLDDLQDTTSDHSDQERRKKFVQEFQTTEQRIYQILAERKEMIIAERIVACLELMYRKLINQLNQRIQTYQAKYEQLSRLYIRNLSEFVRTQQEQQSRKFFEHYDRRSQKLRIRLQEIFSDTKQECLTIITKAQSKQQLQDILKKELPTQIQNFLSDKYEKLLWHFQSKITKLAEEQHEQFKQEFVEQYFSKLQALEQNIPEIHITINFDCNINTNTNAASVDQAINNEIFATSAGVLIGGIVGTIIAPGLGSVIGAGLGGFLGNLFGASLETVKQQQYEALCKYLDTKFYALDSNSQQQFNTVFRKTVENLTEIISHYFDIYNHTVEQMMQDLEKEKQTILRENQQTQNDIQQIQSHQVSIDRFRQHCL